MTDHPLMNRIALGAALAASVALAFVGFQADRLARIGAGYKAKIACSEIFLAGRGAETVINNEFEGIDPMMTRIKVRVDQNGQNVRASGPLGFGQARALYREGYGCTLANGGRVNALPDLEPVAAGAPWPQAEAASDNALAHVDYAAVNAALSSAFEDNEAAHRAVLVVVDGKIIAERYAQGFSKDTPFLSWSMAKSVTATLIGAAVQRGLISIDDAAPVAAWRDDPVRSRITWRDLLQMQSGLAFEEEYGRPRSAVNRMLFEAPDAGGAAARSVADYNPGEFWHYSSGASNILSSLLRGRLSLQDVDDQQFARDALFGPIGAQSVTLEPDAKGVFIGSSFAYATARDWARLGQLHLQNGIWNGARLLPEDWTAFVAEPASASDNQYGAHFWLNRDGVNGRERFFPGLPEDVYMMSGHEGQYVLIIPSKRMVIVRTGMTRGRDPMPAIAPLITAIYDAVDDAPRRITP